MKVEVFDQLWKRKQYGKALALYHRLKRPFFLSKQVARHLERQRKTRAAVKELEHLVAEYLRLQIPLPIPNTDELFKLGRFYATRDRLKARRFLNLYLAPDPYGVGCTPRHETTARKILSKIA